MTANHSGKLKMHHEKIIEIDATPDLIRYKPIVILKEEEFAKLINVLNCMKTAWLTMRFNNTLFLFWGNLVFLHSSASFHENTGKFERDVDPNLRKNEVIKCLRKKN